MKRALVVLAIACGGSEPPAPMPAPAPSTWPVPTAWRSEVIKFPLDFAPTLAHRGYEELRFPPGFFDPAKSDYWSYAFTWRTEDPADLDANALGAEVTAYFRGLIEAVDEQHQIGDADRAKIAAKATAAKPGRFTLEARVYDAFKTGQAIDLVGWAERRACRTGALWVFVLAPETTSIRDELEQLAARARC